MMDHILKLTVIDGGRTKRRQELGHVTFPLRDLDQGDTTEQQLFKMDLVKVDFFYFPSYIFRRIFTQTL